MRPNKHTRKTALPICRPGWCLAGMFLLLATWAAAQDGAGKSSLSTQIERKVAQAVATHDGADTRAVPPPAPRKAPVSKPVPPRPARPAVTHPTVPPPPARPAVEKLPAVPPPPARPAVEKLPAVPPPAPRPHVGQSTVPPPPARLLARQPVVPPPPRKRTP